ncbi:MAG: EAL domain-containing protein, partial [Acidimicrobiales bacterium]
TLSKLVDFPVDELKIDRSFVSRVLTNHKALAVVRAAVDLAQAMDLVTVAEGVEDEATYTALVELGVDLIQGYHVARPMPPSACAPFLAEFEAHGVGSESATA